MLEYIASNGTVILVGQNAKENDTLTRNSSPDHWWIHVSGYPGAHVVIQGTELLKEAMVLAVKHSRAPDTKMTRVDIVRVHQVEQMRSAGQVKLNGPVIQRTVRKKN
jgi:predicted ribosome quality control (RQC) complex YloA/Tae2 family protein